MLKLIGQSQPQAQFGKPGIQRVSSPIYQLNEGSKPFWVITLYYPFWLSIWERKYCLSCFIKKHIYYFIFKTYMHPSFQSATYTHSFQSQIHGPSGLKVFDGEDLSIQSYSYSKWRSKENPATSIWHLVEAARRREAKALENEEAWKGYIWPADHSNQRV